jgi:hypothetical protein
MDGGGSGGATALPPPATVAVTEEDTKMEVEPTRTAFQPRPLIPHASRPSKPTPPVLPRPHRMATGGSLQASGNFPVRDQFKRAGGARGRNRHPHLPVRNRRPQGADIGESKDGGAPTGRSGGAPPPPAGGGVPTEAAKERFAVENMTRIDELPSRPEVRRAGLDSLAWPTRNQVTAKLKEATYYVPRHVPVIVI